ncbi:VgrG-related protein [Embleya hyalina]|uniref:Type IV secretion protein Rhs n=1 Tax=Embleya hyalina TaxID=516124 RepID=A0A401Z4L8_9ACTN|nr:VgrG-related protein [Embleya hyalina]GCE01790.1 type IV secretion protein Rhs [Embleya hyalina]
MHERESAPHAARWNLTLGGGKPDPGLHRQLVTAWVDSAIGEPDQTCLVFRDEQGRSVLDHKHARVAGPLTITVDVDAAARADTPSAPPLFTGEIIALGTRVVPDDPHTGETPGTFTLLWAKSLDHRLDRGRRVEAYADRTLREIVETVVGRHKTAGGALKVGRVDDPDPGLRRRFDQLNLTDREFLLHLAEERGLDLAIAHGEIALRTPRPARDAPPPTPPTPRRVLPHDRILRGLEATLSAQGQVAAIEVRGWDPHTKSAVSTRVDVATSTRLDTPTTAGTLVHAFADPEPPRLLVAARPYTTRAETTHAAKALAADRAASSTTWQAQISGTPTLRAGDPVTFAGAGTPFTGRYTLTRCRHLCTEDQPLTTHLTFGPRPTPVVPPPPPMHAPGVAVGQVDDVKKPDRDGYGAVRLKLPWLSEDYLTDWVRVLQPAGNAGMFGPAVGDEVLVGFEHGRLDRPYVLGGLHNGVDRPLDHTPARFDEQGRINRCSWATRAGDRVELLTQDNGLQGVRLTTETADGTGARLFLDRRDTAVALDAGPRDKRTAIHLDGRDAAIVLTTGTGGHAVELRLDGRTGALHVRTRTGDLEFEAANIRLKATDRVAIVGSRVDIGKA